MLQIKQKLILCLISIGCLLLFTGGLTSEEKTHEKKIEIELFAMSFCPYGVQAENHLLQLLKHNPDLFDFKLFFIASVSKTTAATHQEEMGKPPQASRPETDNEAASAQEKCAGSPQQSYGRFRSLHGAPEIIENIRQLVILKYFPEKFYDYLLLRNKNLNQTDPKAIMAKLSIDAQFVDGMIDTEEGQSLLEENIKESERRSINASPTIFINGKEYRSRLTKNPLLREICKAGRITGLCDSVPVCGADLDCPPRAGESVACVNPETPEAACVYGPEVSFAAYVVNKSDTSALSSTNVIKKLKEMFPGISIVNYDYEKEEGKNILSEYGVEFVPAIFMDKKVETSVKFKRIASSLRMVRDKYVMKEGAITNRYYFSRSPKSKTLELFVNSTSPSAMQLENLLMSQNDLSFTINYAVNVIPRIDENNLVLVKNGEQYKLEKPQYMYGVSSRLGKEDVEEDIRQLCIQKYKPEILRSYLRCNNNEGLRRNFDNKCYEMIIGDNTKIEKCNQTKEGIEMLAKNSVYARTVKANSDVAVLVNNRYLLQQFDLNQLYNIFRTIEK